MSLFEKLPFKKMAEEIPEETKTKVPILGKAIPFANQIVCGLVVLLVVVIIIAASVAGKGGSGPSQAQQTGISDNDEPFAVHKSGPGGDYFYELLSVFDKIITEDGIVICGYTGIGGTVNIPAKIENLQVVRITRGAFEDNTSITSVVIPDGVKEIDANAFNGCTGLTRVTIPDSVTTIREGTFGDCASLTNVTLPKTLKSIENIAFYGCTSLTGITLPDTLEEIGRAAFRQCINLHTVNIPYGIKTIGRLAFAECGELYNLTIPSSITTITWNDNNNSQFDSSGKLPLATRQRLSQLGYDRKGFF